jgi:DNA-binding CsgD family transcriptional regulator
MVRDVMSAQQKKESARRIAETLSKGLIVVDADGQVVWADARLRRRLDGELKQLSLPLNRTRLRSAIDGFLATVELEIGGVRQQVCVVQELSADEAAAQDLQRIIDSVEEVLAEPSWLTNTLVDKLKARLQAGRSTSKVADLKKLTAREREILGLVCEGCTDAQMAQILKLSQNTVRNHLASMFRKIGVNRRSAAVIWARERAITKHDTLDTSALREAGGRVEDRL